ncbi:MAG TPA: amidohydrolase [Gemmatimonadaceae bacterium]|nr:amidohydrolase [Gemmatimonadaceae bacterium]
MTAPRRLLVACLLLLPGRLRAQQPDLVAAEIDRRATALADKLVAWRHDIHEHPELSFQEVRTSKLVADHLRSLGIEVRTGVGGNGVVGVLRGGKPGPVVALRADMDALPVAEQVDVPFKSTVRTTYNGVETGVMHACGHDMHTAMLMGTAEVLSGMRAQLPGTVVFLFQPAEEAPPKGGAGPMIADGAMDNPKVDAVFGLHVGPGPIGAVHVRAGPTTAAADGFRIVVHGRQTHGAFPSAGVDPIVVGSQIVLALQTIVSRQIDLTTAPAVVTVGAFQGGLRENIIPDSVWMIGTIRTYDEAMRASIHERMRRIATDIAHSAGATADVEITRGYDVTVNDTMLVNRMVPTLRRVAGPGKFAFGQPSVAGEDFSRFAARAPGVFVSLGVTPATLDWRTAAVNHSPLFQADDSALPIGVRIMSSLAVDYLRSGRAQ